MTSRDVKQFLADQFTQNPSLFTDNYGDLPSPHYNLACTPTAWKRRVKCSFDYYTENYGDICPSQEDIDVTCIRRMYLPNTKNTNYPGYEDIECIVIEYEDNTLELYDFLID